MDEWMDEITHNPNDNNQADQLLPVRITMARRGGGGGKGSTGKTHPVPLLIKEPLGLLKHLPQGLLLGVPLGERRRVCVNLTTVGMLGQSNWSQSHSIL